MDRIETNPASTTRNNKITVILVAGPVGLLWLTTSQTCSTYYATPYVENFSRFVHPFIDHDVSKVTFLFSPLLLICAGIASIFISKRFLDARYPRLRSLNSRSSRAVILVLWSLLVYLMLGLEHDRAIHAGLQLSGKWPANPATWVDPFCSAVRFGGLAGT